MKPTRIVTLSILVIILMSVLSLWKQLVIYNDASTTTVVQFPSGSLAVYDSPGYHQRWFGNYEVFKRSNQYWFSNKSDEGGAADGSIKTRFNDGAHASISGAIRWDMPVNPDCVLDIYRTYHTQKAVEHELIGQCIVKSVYMTGPLMSSKESNAEKRPDLLNFIEDQAANGVYQTITRDDRQIDPITQQPKTVKIVEIAKGKDGKILRQEDSPLNRFGLKLYNLNINEVKYEDVVEKQIAQQQEAIMQVQTAIAQAKKAEQDALTTAKQGEAAAAKAKWEQEVLKAKAVTEAEQQAQVATTAAKRDKDVAELAANQRKNVAELDKQAAEFKRQEQIALGEGEAARAKLVMEANGALEQKLEAWVKVQSAWSQALSNYKGQLTPMVVTGATNGAVANGAGTNDNAFSQFMSLMSAKTAKDLALDMTMVTSHQK